MTFRKEIIGEGTNVHVNHLLRSLPFTTKTRLCTIRKQAIYQTLLSMNQHVRKSYGLAKLLDIAKEAFDYDKKLSFVVRNITKFQRVCKKYLQNLELRLQGPGIPVSKCVNEDCPYTMESLTDIPKADIFTWKDDKIYGCDFHPLYQLVSNHMERNGTLYEDKESDYMAYIQEYSRLSRATNRRRFNRSRLGSIHNPFTRSPFPGEAFRRLLSIGKRRGLMSTEPRNHRIHARNRRNRNINDHDSESDQEVSEPRIHEPNVTEISNEVSEHLRTLEFYTPDTILTDIIRPITEYIRSARRSPQPLEHAHSVRMHSYITNSCIPILEHLADHYTSSVIRGVVTRRNYLRDFYRQFRRGYFTRMLNEQNRLLENMIHDNYHHRIVNSRVRRLCKFFLTIWRQTIRILRETFNSPDVNTEDKKSVAIFVIISLAQTGHLREGFEWAVGL